MNGRLDPARFTLRTLPARFEKIKKTYLEVTSDSQDQIQREQRILEAFAELQEANLSGIAPDEDAAPGRVDALLDALVARVLDDAAAATRRPHTFLGVGGHKLFRDAVWGELRFVFQADHRRYRGSGYYDFPQRRTALRLGNLAAPLLRVPAVRKR